MINKHQALYAKSFSGLPPRAIGKKGAIITHDAVNVSNKFVVGRARSNPRPTDLSASSSSNGMVLVPLFYRVARGISLGSTDQLAISALARVLADGDAPGFFEAVF